MKRLQADVHAVFDTETTGFDPQKNEIVQIGIFVLDESLNRWEEHMPLEFKMRPDRQLDVNPEALKKCNLTLDALNKYGVSQTDGADFLFTWFERLNLPQRARLTPVGQNINFDIAFMKAWLGEATYAMMFNHRARDTMCIAGYINDRYIMFGRQPPFMNLELSTLCSVLGVVNECAHDALSDCMATAELYRKLAHFPLP